MRRLLEWLGFHQHYWGIWHIHEGSLRQTCYSCGAVKAVKVRLDT